MNDDSIKILNKVKSGELSVEDAAQLLQELENLPAAEAGTKAFPPQAAPLPSVAGSETSSSEPPAPHPPTGEHFDAQPQVIESISPGETPPDLGWWKNAWLIPFWVGTGILVLAAVMMGWSYSAKNFFWFYCSWLPMLFGLLVLFLSWWSQQARWVHVRVHEPGGKSIAISLPLPLRLSGCLLRIFGRYIPHMEEPTLKNLPEILDELAKEKGPTTVEVDDPDGSKVRVYIL